MAFGSTDPAICEARDILSSNGLSTDYLRLRALPLSDEVRAFIEAHEQVVVVELNQDGQLAMILRMEYPALATRIVSIAHCDGLPLSAEFVATRVRDAVGKKALA